jgi:hypothetical protein
MRISDFAMLVQVIANKDRCRGRADRADQIEQSR